MNFSEEVIENLESHQLELQTMIGMGKFVDFFRDRVLHWQGTLGQMEDVLKVWVNVSRSWAALESIFLASADIRSQLPDDTKRFEGIDSEFKELMKDAVVCWSFTPHSITTNNDNHHVECTHLHGSLPGRRAPRISC